ncbi:serine/threonine kinase [Aureococcus anophagefferens]|nr:serine/threonine kinase [Aureococcus anophagefferens]
MAPSSVVGLPSPRTPSEPPTPPPRDDASDLLSASVFSSHWYDEHQKPLRVKGVLVKKDGSRRRSLTKVLTGRATWSERHFFLDVAAGKLSYFYDAGLARRAGVVRLEPFVSAARPVGGPDHEFEILHSRDEGGAARDGGFLLRAPSAGIMGEWLESLRRSVREVSHRRAAEEKARAAAVLEDDLDEAVLATEKDFEPIRVVGKGASGAVLLVRKKSSGAFYAMKVMSKRAIYESKMEKSALVEREVLLRVRSPFLVNLRYSFQSRTKLYLVTDFYGGGSLEGALRREAAFPERCARFFAGELALAVDHLQSRSVLHRDIKAANVLLDTDGHCYLADYGLARLGSSERDGARRSFAGTLEYMAPETISKNGTATSAVDWWALGVLLYEMLVGRTPFYDAKPRTIFENILRAEPAADALSPAAADLVRGLLVKAPARRLAALADVAETPFFAALDFGALREAARPALRADDDYGVRSARLRVVRACEAAFVDGHRSLDRQHLQLDGALSQENDPRPPPPPPPKKPPSPK